MPPLNILGPKHFLAFGPFWPFRTIHYLAYPTIKSHPSSNQVPIVDSLLVRKKFCKSVKNGPIGLNF